MSAPLVFRLPLPANLVNSGRGRSRHWRAAHAEKQAFRRACDAYQAAGLVPPPPPRPIARATIAARLTVWNAMDDDNAMARTKVAVDWLRTRGYLAGDTRRHLRWVAMPEQTITRDPARYALEITITPIPPEPARPAER